MDASEDQVEDSTAGQEMNNDTITDTVTDSHEMNSNTIKDTVIDSPEELHTQAKKRLRRNIKIICYIIAIYI